jgi:predicted ArsR family transcriptional regulator
VKTSRQRITEYLALRRHSTTQEIAHALRLSPADVRHHLKDLTSEGVVQVGGTIKSESRGRPAKTYILTRLHRENNLGILANALLETIVKPCIEQSEKILFDLAGRIIGNGFSAKSGSQRLIDAVKRLNELHYQSRWEAHPEAPRLLLNHCPYLEILAKNPILCQLDRIVITRLTGNEAEQVAKLAIDVNGRCYCLFRLKRGG